MANTPLLPVSRQSRTASLSLSRTPTPSRIRIGRFSPTGPLPFGARHYSLSPPPSPSPLDQPTTLSGRLKALIKKYGWYALGMYFVLSAVDLTIAFAAIHLIGAERVSHWTTQAKEFIYGMIHPDRDAPEHPDTNLAREHAASKGGREGLIAMFILAYTVHKTLFLPFRVGLTAALTPKLVKWLTSRGWTGRAGSMRAASHLREKVRRGKDRMED